MKTCLRHAVFSEFGKHVRNICVKHAVRRENNDIARGKAVSVLIKKICKSVKRDGRFSAARNALNKTYFACCVSDYLVLFALYGIDNGLHFKVAVFAEFVHENVVFDRHIAVKHILKFAVADNELAFEFQIAFHTSRGTVIELFTETRIVKKRRYIRTPVADENIGTLLIYKRTSADINLVRVSVLLDVKAGKIRIIRKTNKRFLRFFKAFVSADVALFGQRHLRQFLHILFGMFACAGKIFPCSSALFVNVIAQRRKIRSRFRKSFFYIFFDESEVFSLLIFKNSFFRHLPYSFLCHGLHEPHGEYPAFISSERLHFIICLFSSFIFFTESQSGR